MRTTLPERRDRSLFVALDVSWCYRDPFVAIRVDDDKALAADAA